VPRTDPGAWGQADLGGGSFGTSKVSAAGGFAHARWTGLLVAQKLMSDGDFSYVDDNATDDNADDDTLRTRSNNAFEASSLTARLAFGPVSALWDHLEKTQGVPGTGANTAEHASLATDRDVATLRAAAKAWAVTAYSARQRDRFKDRERELSGSRQDNDDRTYRGGARAELKLAPLEHNALQLLAEARKERYAPTMNLPTYRDLPDSRRELAVLGAEDRHGFGALELGGQVRREMAFDDFPAGPAYPGALPSPAVARTTRFTRWTGFAQYQLTSALAVKGSVSQLGRIPTLEELFGNRGAVHGNRDAQPEEVFTRDLGLVVQRGTVEAQLSAYRSDADDLLVWIQNSQNSSVAQNVGNARLEGVELSARGAVHGVRLDGSWTRQWTKDEGQVSYWRGNELPGRPKDEASLGVSSQQGPVRAFGELHAMSAFWLDRYNQKQVPSRTLVDLGASYAFAEGTTDVVLECRNVGDVHAQDFGGYPLPGRSWALGVRFHLVRKAGPS